MDKKRLKRNLIVIDGHNFLFKAYGVPFKFYSKIGTPLHVVNTFIALVKRAIKTVDKFGGCTDIAIVFDSENATSNHALLKDYKANRKDYSQVEDSPFTHLPFIQKSLKHLKIKTYEKKGIEADDLIASLATQYLGQYKTGKVFVFSNDSDFYQLLSNNVKQVIFKNKGIDLVFGPKELKEKLNIVPKQYVYFKSLTGDVADNIKGIPGIGPIRASQIINKKIEINLRDYTSIISNNQKLIKLNAGINVCKNIRNLELNSKIISCKNQKVFDRLGF